MKVYLRLFLDRKFLKIWYFIVEAVPTPVPVVLRGVVIFLGGMKTYVIGCYFKGL